LGNDCQAHSASRAVAQTATTEKLFNHYLNHRLHPERSLLPTGQVDYHKIAAPFNPIIVFFDLLGEIINSMK